MNLTIAYFTNRKNPKIEWFGKTLSRECRETGFSPSELIVIDYHAEDDGRRESVKKDLGEGLSSIPLYHICPKPCVWQGKHRKTKENYFAASNARNTAFARCSSEFIACVDDLSALERGWLNQVRHAMEHHYVVLGAYKKVIDLEVGSEAVTSYQYFAPGVDSRWNRGADGIVPADGSWLYGCSFALPIQAALDVNGFNEMCDATGMEDVEFGIRVGRKGYKFFYNRNMLTFESEELHHASGNEHFKRESILTTTGEMSDWAIYNRVTKTSIIRADNEFDLTELRQKILRGEDFPVPQTEIDWRTGKKLCQL